MVILKVQSRDLHLYLQYGQDVTLAVFSSVLCVPWFGEGRGEINMYGCGTVYPVYLVDSLRASKTVYS